MNDTIKDQAIYWAACNQEGLNTIEKNNLNKWLNENEKHKIAFDEAQNIYTVFQNIPKKYSQEASQEAHKKIKKIKKIKVYEQIKPVLSYAAAFFLVIVVSLKTYEYYSPTFEAQYISKNENINKKALLPDGTVLTMDRKTQIAVTFYHDKRKILLKRGQVFFEVAKDKTKVFVIDSGQVQIQVLGTSFEVQKHEDFTDVSVVEGVVKVSHIYNKNKNAAIIARLEKGDKISVNNKGKVKFFNKVVINEVASWREGKLIFNENTLKEAFDTFAKYNDFEIESTIDLTNTSFSGTFKINEIDKFLNVLKSVYSHKITKLNDKIILTRE